MSRPGRRDYLARFGYGGEGRCARLGRSGWSATRDRRHRGRAEPADSSGSAWLIALSLSRRHRQLGGLSVRPKLESRALNRPTPSRRGLSSCVRESGGSLIHAALSPWAARSRRAVLYPTSSVCAANLVARRTLDSAYRSLFDPARDSSCLTSRAAAAGSNGLPSAPTDDFVNLPQLEGGPPSVH